MMSGNTGGPSGSIPSKKDSSNAASLLIDGKEKEKTFCNTARPGTKQHAPIGITNIELMIDPSINIMN